MSPSTPPMAGPSMNPGRTSPSMPKRLARSSGGGDVGHVSVGNRDIGLHGALNRRTATSIHSAEASAVTKKLTARPSKAHQQHGPAAGIGRARQDGRTKEVSRARRGHCQEAEGLLVIAAREQADDVRQHGHHDADRDHVNQHRDHDEAHTSGALGTGLTRSSLIAKSKQGVVSPRPRAPGYGSGSSETRGDLHIVHMAFTRMPAEVISTNSALDISAIVAQPR